MKEEEIKFTDKKIDQSWKEAIEQEKGKTPESGATSVRPIAFAEFVSSIGMQGLIHLGEIEHPVSKKKEQNLEAAHETIEVLILIKDKTKGNLTAEEDSLLTAVLADLQLRYVKNVP